MLWGVWGPIALDGDAVWCGVMWRCGYNPPLLPENKPYLLLPLQVPDEVVREAAGLGAELAVARGEQGAAQIVARRLLGPLAPRPLLVHAGVGWGGFKNRLVGVRFDSTSRFQTQIESTV